MCPRARLEPFFLIIVCPVIAPGRETKLLRAVVIGVALLSSIEKRFIELYCASASMLLFQENVGIV